MRVSVGVRTSDKSSAIFAGTGPETAEAPADSTTWLLVYIIVKHDKSLTRKDFADIFRCPGG